MYLHIVFGCQWLYILVSVGVMLCNVVSEWAMSVLSNLSTWLLIFGWHAVVENLLISKHSFLSAKKFDTNCSPLSISRYVGIPYGVTQLSTNSVVAVVYVTVVTGIALFCFFYLFVKTITADCRISFLVVDQNLHSRKFEWARCWKRTQLLEMTVSSTLLCAKSAVGYFVVHMHVHLKPVILALQCIIETYVTQVTIKHSILR